MQRLPIGDYRWERDGINDAAAVRDKVMALTPDDERGLVLDVNLKFPPHVVKDLSEFVPCPESKFVGYKDMGRANQVVYQRIYGKHSNKNFFGRKLITDFTGTYIKNVISMMLIDYDDHNDNDNDDHIPFFLLTEKKNYCVYGTTLKLYLQLGVEMESCNHIISFKQEAFCKPFIELLAWYRRHYSKKNSKLYTTIMKLIPNSCFGKFIQAMRNLLGKSNLSIKYNI